MILTHRPVTVLCVDDQAGFRAVLRELIAATPGFIHIGEARSGDDAIEVVAKARPDLVLMDVWMPGLNGFETASTILERRRGAVVILTSADALELPAEYRAIAGRVVLVPKQDLCPRVLLDVWHGRATVLRRG
jgi:chemotaxis response regulator CheB